MTEATKTFDRHVILKRAFDFLLIAAMIYAALLAFGVIRRGGRFEEGRPAPAFAVRDVENGKEVRLADYRGKPVLLNFFSTGCPSCRRELPHIAEMKAEAGDRLEVLVISTDSPAELKSFFKQESIALPAGWDRGVAHQAYGVDTIPYLVMIDKEGKIRGDYIGGISWSDIEPYL
jgi:cytochrome c biogenesis protein CcmG/thiol:disulfide interchange protein DsbE